MVAGFKCRRRSTLVERSVESPDTFSRDRSLTKQSSSVFNQLPRSRLEHVFGRRSALFSGVEGGQMLEERRKTTALFIRTWRKAENMTIQNSTIIGPSGVIPANGVVRTNCLRYRIRGKAKLSIVVLTTALGIFASSCNRGRAATATPVPEVEVATVEQRDVPVYSEWVATLDGYVNAQMQPQVSGYIIKQDYKEGSLVRKGQVLFEIDPRPFKAALDRAKGDLAQAQAQLGKSTLDVERDTPLAEARAIAKSQLDNEIQAKLGAQAAVESGRAAVEQAELNLEFTRVTSLVNGIAGIAQVQIGNLVGPNSILTSVSQVDPIKAYFTVSEQEFTSFHRRYRTQESVEEQRRRIPLDLLLSDGSVYEHRGTIYFADREVNPATGAIRIAGVFPNPDNLLRPGSFGRVRAAPSTYPGALLIPQKAVIELQGSHQVAVVGDDNKVNIRPVTVGDRVGRLWIVTEGLKPGERVVVEGLLKVRDGTLVNVKAASAETAKAGG